MNLFNIFKPGMSKKDLETRRIFLRNSMAAMFGAAALANADKVFPKSETGFSFLKPSGEIVNNYMPLGGGDVYVGQLTCVPYNFAPTGFLFCDGQILQIVDNTTLFTLIGTTYGGDGASTFALPDLRGRVPIHNGQGSGLTNHLIGEVSGAETHTLTNLQMPAHNHSLSANSADGTSSNPAGNYSAQNSEGERRYKNSNNSNMNSGSVTATGSSQSHGNMMPFISMHWIISLFGIFPSQFK